MVATLSVNVAANTVSPSYDFSNLAPRLVSFRTGGLITGVIGILIQPWRLLSNPHIYIFTWLGFYGGLLGAIAGVLIADYWVMRRGQSCALCRPVPGSTVLYWYRGGWNWRAVAAFGHRRVARQSAGPTPTPNNGPFPAHGMIPVLKPLYDYSWVVGLGVGFALYLVLSLPVFGRTGDTLADLSFRHWASGTGLPALGFRHWASGTGLPALGFRHWVFRTGIPGRGLGARRLV